MILFADMIEILLTLLPILFVVISVLFKVLSSQKERGDVPPRPGGPVSPPDEDERHRQEIEVFLRRAAGKQDEQIAEDVEIIEPEQERRQQRPLRPRKVLEAEVIEDVDVVSETMLAASISETTRRLLPSQFAKHPHLAEDIEQADEKLADHLHATFDHKLGRLGAEEAKEVALARVQSGKGLTSRLTAAEFAEMLKTPAAARNAIILNEILRRPEHRW